MFGSTPMLEAFRAAKDRFALELGRGSITSPPILFVLSDGEPDHDEDQLEAMKQKIREVAQSMKDQGVLVVSCFFTKEDQASQRRLYGELGRVLGPVAAFMHSLASPLPEGGMFAPYLKEKGWLIDPGGRLFSQANHTENLTELLALVLDPLLEGEDR